MSCLSLKAGSWVSKCRPSRAFGRILPCLALLAVVAAAFAQCDSTRNLHPRGAATGSAGGDSTRATDWHAIYTGIQTGFVKLEPIFHKGCFDCHGNQTHYPWYHAIPGIKQLIDKDIRVAHMRLDMSNGFPFNNKSRPADDLARIKDELEGGDMPPWDYRLMHWNANPSKIERDSVIAWLDSSLRALAAHGQYPMGIQPTEAPDSDQGEEGSDSGD